MKIFKKLLKRRYIYALAILLAAGFGIHYSTIDPLDIALDTPTNKLKNYIQPNKILVISFWASWCPYCKKEVSVLKQLKTQNPEIDIIGLQVDSAIPDTIFQNTGYPNINASNNGARIMQLYGNFSAGVPFIVILKNEKFKTFFGETTLFQLEQNIAAI